MARLKVSSREFYEMTPVEFYYAMKDFNDIHFLPFRNVCEVTRWVGQLVYNSNASKRSEVERDPTKLFKFGWDEKKAQSLEEMKAQLRGMVVAFGGKVKKRKKKKKRKQEATKKE